MECESEFKCLSLGFYKHPKLALLPFEAFLHEKHKKQQQNDVTPCQY